MEGDPALPGMEPVLRSLLNRTATAHVLTPQNPRGPWRMAPPGQPPPCIELQEFVWLTFQKILFSLEAKPSVLDTGHPESLQVL